MHLIRISALIAGAALLASCGGGDGNASPTATPATPGQTPVNTAGAPGGSSSDAAAFDGSGLLIVQSDLSGFPYSTGPNDVWDDSSSTVLDRCANDLPLYRQIAGGGPDIARGNTYSQGPINVMGGQGVGSVALRGRDDDEASAIAGKLSSPEFATCFLEWFVAEAQSAGYDARNAGVTELPPADRQGLSHAVQSALYRTTTGSVQQGFTQYSDWVTARSGRNVVWLILTNDDGPVPEDLRTRLTSKTLTRLTAATD